MDLQQQNSKGLVESFHNSLDPCPATLNPASHKTLLYLLSRQGILIFRGQIMGFSVLNFLETCCFLSLFFILSILILTFEPAVLPEEE
jgi:hypothetical protein